MDVTSDGYVTMKITQSVGYLAIGLLAVLLGTGSTRISSGGLRRR